MTALADRTRISPGPPGARFTGAATASRLLGGPHLASGRESFADHRVRLGPRPEGGRWLLETVAASGLRGRGGAGFPVARKWQAVASRAASRPVLVVNASEGEPLSAKDRTLVTLRPHLVLDGAFLAAETIGAEDVVVYLSKPFRSAVDAVGRALRERSRAGLREIDVRVVRTAHRYVSGESSAVVQRVGGGPAKPRFTPPHPSERGVGNRPTLVQNAETLGHVALVARYGSAWFRECGAASSPGTALMTLSGNVLRPGVYEVDLGATVGAVIGAAGGTPVAAGGALLGGYFGTWVGPVELPHLPLGRDALASFGGASLGCGVLGVLGADGCGVAEAGRVITYLAAESAGQCGPCVHGLRAMASTMSRVVASEAVPADVARLRRWADMVRGRGACHHPDGAAANLVSALDAFSDHLDDHLAGRPCPGRGRWSLPAPPRRQRGWR